MQVLLKWPTLREAYHISKMDHERRDTFRSDPYANVMHGNIRKIET